MTVAPALADFLALASRTPFAWGRADCCLWVADWLVVLGRPDPAAAWRGRYRTARGAARILGKHRGVLGLAGAAAALTGLTATEAPIAGDVGVVDVQSTDGQGPAAAICTGRRWAVRAPAGLIIGEMAPRAAWRV